MGALLLVLLHEGVGNLLGACCGCHQHHCGAPAHHEAQASGLGGDSEGVIRICMR
jgi:hypothetical protein